jgi:hypothetical protein
MNTDLVSRPGYQVGFSFHAALFAPLLIQLRLDGLIYSLFSDLIIFGVVS